MVDRSASVPGFVQGFIFQFVVAMERRTATHAGFDLWRVRQTPTSRYYTEEDAMTVALDSSVPTMGAVS